MKMARGRKIGVWREKKKQSQPCLSERANKSGGEEKMEKVVIQGLANPELGTCAGNLSHTSDPV